MVDPIGVTGLLLAWGKGDEEAFQQLVPLVERELHRVAKRCMAGERAGHSLQATALVNEAYVRLIDAQQVKWQDRAHFLAMSARMMRRILVNHARDRIAAKRGGAAERVPLTIVAEQIGTAEVDLLGLHDALERLAALDARKGQIVELKFFGGLTMD